MEKDSSFWVPFGKDSKVTRNRMLDSNETTFMLRSKETDDGKAFVKEIKPTLSFRFTETHKKPADLLSYLYQQCRFQLSDRKLKILKGWLRAFNLTVVDSLFNSSGDLNRFGLRTLTHTYSQKHQHSEPSLTHTHTQVILFYRYSCS